MAKDKESSGYNDIIQDRIIPTIFHALYDLTSEIHSEDRELTLLHQPKDAGFYEFKALPEDVVYYQDDTVEDSHREKSFHTDTYCFDSKPEQELFWQYVESEQINEVYFTGMFTAKQGELGIQYFDPQSKRVRHYYPDFVARKADGTWQLIEVKGDNKIEDELVLAKADAATELAVESGVEYVIYPSSRIMKTNVLEPDLTGQTGSL